MFSSHSLPRALGGMLTIAFSLSLGGCGDSNVPPQSAAPVEGKRLDGTTVATDTPKETPEVKPLTPEEEKKKRDEWRDKKTGKADPNDPIAQANITLRPSLGETKDAAAKDKEGGAKDPTKDSTKAKLPDDPTALAKPLVDPNAPIPFVDPNNPDFIPADRTLWKKFDIKKLHEIEGHLIVPFADLSGFPYSGMVGAPEVKPAEKDSKEPAAEKKPEFSIPDAIKALHGKKVMVAGYMMPIDFEDGGTNEFVLTRQVPSCFYCVPPQLNDWVEVKMKDGKRVPYVPDGLIELYGTIEVGEMQEDGFVVNMYRMTGVKVVEAKKN